MKCYNTILGAFVLYEQHPIFALSVALICVVAFVDLFTHEH